MKEGRQRQAEHTQRLKQLGLRQVAVWVSDTEGWMITQASRGAKADRLDTAADYIAGLVNRSRQALVDSFMAGPGKMALFEIEKDDQRKALGVKLAVFRSMPVLITQIMTADTTFRDFIDAHPLLEQATTLSHYHWDTPGFRETCAALDLDPDSGRPRFRPPYEDLAEELLRGVAARFEHPLGLTTEIMLDALDLMRADLRPNPSLLNRARKHLPEIEPARLPHAEELTRLIGTDELLHISTEQHLANDGIGMQHAVIDFLPSRHGAGYSATIAGFFGEYASDGWVAEAYAGLHGIAVEPDTGDLADSAWLRVVRRRLADQGVIFMPKTKVGDYLETEGVYWIYKQGGTGKWRDARTPSWGERMIWRLKPPPLLVDRELSLRELARRGDAGGGA
jgi:hypothetical protein